MIIYFDTEFTDLTIDPRLLSIGMVVAGRKASEFYAEVTDRDRLAAASRFAVHVVLPQFGKIAHARCSYASLGARLGVFLDRTVESLGPDEAVEIAFTYDLDWELALRAMRDAGALPQEAVLRRVRPRNVYDIAGFGAGKRASERYFESQHGAPIARHHALCDARALRIACEASVERDDATGFFVPARSEAPRVSAYG